MDVGGRPVRVKLALLGGAVVNAQPEYDDIASAAAALDLPGQGRAGPCRRRGLHAPRPDRRRR